MAYISVEDAIDLHIHCAPSIVPRLVTDDEASQGAADAGLQAIVIKSHHESTVTRAKVVDRKHGDMRVFGGVCLNHYVGGINPDAVRAALGLGGKVVWMPSFDALNHHKIAGIRDVSGAVPTGRSRPKPGISVLDSNGRLTDDTVEVLHLVKQFDAILGTSHLSFEEAVEVVSVARRIGVNQVLITHPFFKIPGFSVSQLKHLVELGAVAEFGYGTVSAMCAHATIAEVLDAIRTVGLENAVIMSDCGQIHNPRPHEGLRVFAQCLHEHGMSPDEVYTLIKHNPKRILALD